MATINQHAKLLRLLTEKVMNTMHLPPYCIMTSLLCTERIFPISPSKGMPL